MKKITLLFSILLIVCTLVIVVLYYPKIRINNTEQQSQKNQQNSTKERLPDFARAREEHISVHEAAIRNFYDFPNDPYFKKTVIEGRIFILVGYEEGHDFGTGDVVGGGVSVFEKTTDGKYNLFWESKEYIDQPILSFQDIDNNGISEIIIMDFAGATGRTTNYDIYAWRDGTFKIVVPTEPSGHTLITTIGGDSGETYIKDIDNDKIMEIIDGYISDTDHMLHQEIYKWNGKEYYLWKKVVEKKKYE